MRSRAPRGIAPALTTLGVVGAVGAAAAVWGIGIERYLFTVRFHEIAALPAGATPLRILHLSDAHMAPWQHRKQQWIAALAELQPDLVVNTGDNLGHVDGLHGLRAAFDPLRGIPGVFVHGSNDHVAPSPRNPFKYFMGPSKIEHTVEPLDTEALDEYLTDELGWLNLNNAAGSVDAAGLRIDAFGVSDAHRGWDDLDALPGALAAIRADTAPAALTIGVTGHTHGGQVRVPGFGALVANCDIPLKQARGLSTWSQGGRTVPLNVSAGLGHSIYAPVRFACRPEASVLTLLPRG